MVQSAVGTFSTRGRSARHPDCDPLRALTSYARAMEQEMYTARKRGISHDVCTKWFAATAPGLHFARYLKCIVHGDAIRGGASGAKE